MAHQTQNINRQNLWKEPRGILELKTTLTEMNNLPEETKSRSELTTERCSKLEDGPIESLQPKDQRRKRKGKWRQWTESEQCEHHDAF